jgi:Ca2+-binding EF-hand superfamily protein
LSRDEVYEMFVKLGEYFPGKKTDDLFNRTDEEGDGLMSCDEFIKVYMIELEEA